MSAASSAPTPSAPPSATSPTTSSATVPTLSSWVRSRRLAAVGAALLVAVLAGLTAVASPALADSLSDQRKASERKAAENKKAKEALAASLEGINANLAQAVVDLQVIEQRLPEARAELGSAQESLERTQREQAMIAARLVDAADQEAAIGVQLEADAAKGDQIKVAIGQMARDAYKGGRSTTSVDIVLGASSTEEFIESYGLMTTALRTQTQSLGDLRELEAANRNSQVRLGAVKDRVAELKGEADQKVVEADQARAMAADRLTEINTLVAQQAEKKAAIEADKVATEAEQAKIDAEAAAIEAEVNRIIAQQRAEAEAAAKANGGTVAPPGAIGRSLLSNPTSINPIYVTSNYGMRLHPTLDYVRLHAGIDLRTYCGNPIYAARAGTIQWAKFRYGFGNQVMIDHGFVNGNSLMASYNHLTRATVSAGQKVAQGALVGYSGNTGTSAACHLHLEVYVNGQTTDPRPLLGL